MTTICISQNTTQQNGISDSKASGLADTSLRSFAPTTNYSTIVDLFHVSDDSQIVVFKADLSAIPSGATVNSAILYLNNTLGGTAGGPNTLGCHAIKQSLVVAETTWNAYSTGNNWATAGAKGTADQTAQLDNTGILAPNTGNTWEDLIVTNTIQSFVNGTNANNGFLLRNISGTDIRVFVSAEGTDGRRPELVVDYTAASGISIPIIRRRRG